MIFTYSSPFFIKVIQAFLGVKLLRVYYGIGISLLTEGLY